jgi:putative nucleotidyltransferase with HDIG domain
MDTTDHAERRVRGLELLLRLGMELHSERDLHHLLDRIWSDLTLVLGAERSSLFLVDEESKELYSVIAQNEGEIRFPLDSGIAGHVAVTGKSLLIPDAYGDPRFNPQIDQKTGFRTRSILSVPLRNQRGEVLGVAQVLNRLDGKHFDEEDQLLLEALASTAAVAIETVQLYEEQKRAAEAVISGLLMALEMRAPRGSCHSQEVRAYSKALAEELGFPEDDLRRVEWAAALHDIGKIAVSDRIMTKNAPLSRHEQVEYESHTLWTREFLEAMHFSGELAGVAQIAPYHHKRFEGGGFPEGSPDGQDVPKEARIIAVADALSVLMAPRWGRMALSMEDAMARIRQDAGRAFDPLVVESLQRIGPRLENIRMGAHHAAVEGANHE